MVYNGHEMRSLLHKIVHHLCDMLEKDEGKALLLKVYTSTLFRQKLGSEAVNKALNTLIRLSSKEKVNF